MNGERRIVAPERATAEEYGADGNPYAGGPGISIVGNLISVELTTNGGLMWTGSGDARTLGLQVYADHGLVVDANGVYVKLYTVDDIVVGGIMNDGAGLYLGLGNTLLHTDLNGLGLAIESGVQDGDILRWVERNVVVGTDAWVYTCHTSHISTLATRPITGADWQTVWRSGASCAGVAWVDDTQYWSTGWVGYEISGDAMGDDAYDFLAWHRTNKQILTFGVTNHGNGEDYLLINNNGALAWVNVSVYGL